MSATAQGTVSIRAFRLSPTFVQLYQHGKFEVAHLPDSSFVPTNMLRELPVTITRSALLGAFLSSLPSARDNLDTPLLPSPSYDELTSASTALGAPGSLTFPLQALNSSFESALNSLGNIRYRDRRQKACRSSYV